MVYIWFWIVIIFKLKRSIIWIGLLRLPQQKISDRTILLFLLSHKAHMKACLFLCTQFSRKLLFPSYPCMSHNLCWELHTLFLLTYHCFSCGASSNLIPLWWCPHTPVRTISFSSEWSHLLQHSANRLHHTYAICVALPTLAMWIKKIIKIAGDNPLFSMDIAEYVWV